MKFPRSKPKYEVEESRQYDDDYEDPDYPAHKINKNPNAVTTFTDPSLKVEDECPICRMGALGAKWTRDYHEREDVTIQDLAMTFQCSEAVALEHANYHYFKVSKKAKNGLTSIEIQSPDFFVNELGYMYTSLKDLHARIVEEEGQDSVKVDKMVKLTNSMGTLMKSLGEFSGRLQLSGDSTSKSNKFKQDLDAVIRMISGGHLCNECEKYLFDELEKLKIS